MKFTSNLAPPTSALTYSLHLRWAGRRFGRALLAVIALRTYYTVLFSTIAHLYAVSASRTGELCAIHCA